MTSPSSSQSGRVFGMGACYALGTFTDNFYKQAAVLLAATLHITWVQGAASVLFALPFILFSSHAGWLADRMVKKHIVLAAKTTELLALTGGGLALYYGNWNGILAAVFLMGLQASVFSPALNGSIPEQFPAHQVPRVNSLIKLASTAAVLAGIAAAGFFLDLRPAFLTGEGAGTAEAAGRAAAALFLVVIGVLGVASAFAVKALPPSLPKEKLAPFPYKGPLDSFRHLLEFRKDEQLYLVLLAEAFFYGVAAMAVISVANLAKGLGYSDTTAGLLSAAMMVGIAVGALIAGRAPADAWKRLLFPAATGMGILLAAVSFAPLFSAGGAESLLNPQLCWLFGVLFLCGISGGIYLIPLASFIQVRPSAEEKGKALGVSNFLSFVSIAIWGVLFFAVIGRISPAASFIVFGAATALFAPLVVGRRLRFMKDLSMRDASGGFLSLFLRAVLRLRYRIKEEGLENIPAALPAGTDQNSVEARPRGALFLPNHPALIDPIIVYSRIAGLSPRPLADERQMRGLLQGAAARLLRVVTIPDLRKDGRGGAGKVREALKNITQALQNGDNVLLYPSGRLYRSAKEDLGANSAVSLILEAVPDVRVITVRTTGLWGSRFSYALGKAPLFMRELLRGIAAVFANLLLFTPRREVRVEFSEPGDLPRNADKKTLNAWLERFYNEAARPALVLPRLFWHGKAETMAEVQAAEASVQEAPADVRERVFAILRESAGLPADHPVTAKSLLSRDLNLDSLALMEVMSALEAEFGRPMPSLEKIASAGDCALAAAGLLEEEGEAPGKTVPAGWFIEGKEDAPAPSLPQGCPTLVHAFLRHARALPSLPFLADRNGVKTRRDILTGALVLSKRIQALPGERVGIMLPATPAAPVIWLAALLAGKVPVMLNWTVGLRNMRHCIETAGITHAVTARALLDQLERQGTDLSELPLEFLAAEETAASLTLPEKLFGLVRARLHCAGILPLKPRKVPETCAVLFTSGSESRPKGVPLTHKNLMTNAGDIVSALSIRGGERLLAMLPPFHSFGLLVGIALPAGLGLQAAYHPNPTESAPLAFLIRDFKITLLGATPTFLEGILQKGKGGMLNSLRYCFVGAEKCPERVYAAFAEQCPAAVICEGYGITECSPVVSVNRPQSAVPGTIGQALPSVIAALVQEEGGTAVRRVPQGEPGMLLVRGPSIFGGYLAGPGEEPKNPFVEFEGERWYRTGDLVSQDAEGRMTFRGRLSRFVKLGGEMISLPLMETVLEKALRERPDLPEDGKPYIAVEVRPGSEEEGNAEILAFTPLELTPQEANAAFKAAGLASLYAVRRVVRVKEIPVLGTGKTDYQALKNMGAARQ